MTLISRRSALGSAALLMVAVTAGCSTQGEDSGSDTSTGKADEAPAFAILTVPTGQRNPQDYAATLAASGERAGVEDILFLEAKPSAEGPLGFESLAVVEFENESRFQDWKRDVATELGPDVIVRRADLLVDDRSANKNPHPVFVVSHYEALVPRDDYKTYTESYITPNMEGQKAGGVMTGYAMYYEREPAGKNSKAVLVKEYVDEAAFNRSEAVKEANKPKLLANPEWKRINDTKPAIRTDLSSTLAVPAL